MLAGKSAVITGASYGLGQVMSQSLVAAGVRVYGLARSVDLLDALAQDAKALTGQDLFVPVPADLSTREGCDAALQQVQSHSEGVDILINNAGVGANFARPTGHVGPLRFWECDPLKWDQAIFLNHQAPFHLARHLAPFMIAQSWGRIINVTTNFHTMLGAGRSCYGPGKAGLEASTLIWSKELYETGVTVNILNPGGPTATPIHAQSRGSELHEMLQPEIMAMPILWMCSDQANRITGRRFDAKSWDKSWTLPVLERVSTPAAWDSLSTGVSKMPKFFG
jgi:NAD(P)-dependent dehydrogenase (short-subunit alcohol dehydrogenase family)